MICCVTPDNVIDQTLHFFLEQREDIDAIEDIYSIIRHARAGIVSFILDNLAIQGEFKLSILDEIQAYVDDDFEIAYRRILP